MRWMIACALVACRFGFDEDPATDGDATIDTTFDTTSDGSGSVCEAAACGAAGGTCIAEACEIQNTGETTVQCPTGMPCRILCTAGARPCRDGVSCVGATTCEVRCVGLRACQDGVDCGDSTCTVTCDGIEACESGIRVAPAGTCTSHCCGLDACAGGVATCTNDNVC